MHALTALFTCNMYSKCSDFVHAPHMLTAYFNLCTPHLKERKRERERERERKREGESVCVCV